MWISIDVWWHVPFKMITEGAVATSDSSLFLASPAYFLPLLDINQPFISYIIDHKLWTRHSSGCWGYRDQQDSSRLSTHRHKKTAEVPAFHLSGITSSEIRVGAPVRALQFPLSGSAWSHAWTKPCIWGGERSWVGCFDWSSLNCISYLLLCNKLPQNFETANIHYTKFLPVGKDLVGVASYKVAVKLLARIALWMKAPLGDMGFTSSLISQCWHPLFLAR